MCRRVVAVSLSGVACCIAVQAQGQAVNPQHGADPTGVSSAATDGAQTNAAQEGGLGDIVVTAQRRSENLQAVPITISAFSGERLERAGVTSTLDVPTLVPGLSYSQSVGLGTPYIRGVGTRANGPGAENSVALYVDDVYQPFKGAAVQNLSDISRIEVLKGPQGTLFGRNATGGLLNIITADPQHTLSGKMQVGYGNYNTVSGMAYVTGGIAADLAISASAFVNDQLDGFGHNLTTGRDLNSERDYGFRGKVLYNPGSTRITLSGDWSSYDTTIGLSYRPVYGIKPTYGPLFTGGPFDTVGTFVPAFNSTNWGVSAKVEQNLGAVLLTSITAYREDQYVLKLDQDVEPIDFLTTVQDIHEHATSEELRLSGGRHAGLQWQVGTFLYFADGAQTTTSTGLSQSAAGRGSQVALGDQKTDSYAAYAQATQALGGATRITLGGRYTYEKRRLTGNIQQFILDGTQRVLLPTSKDASFKAPSWRVSIDHDVTDEILAYASYNRGFKSGGFNPGNLAGPAVQPEKLDAFEVGLKTQEFNRHLRLNVAGFYYTYQQIQLNNYVLGVQNLVNAAAARIYGVDIDTESRITERLRIVAGAELLSAKFTSYPNAPGVAPLPSGGNSITIIPNAQGNDLPLAAGFTGNVTLDYTVPLSKGAVNLSANGSYNSGFATEGNNALRQGGYALLNARIAWNAPDEKLQLAVWGRNLTDTRYSNTLTAQAIGSVVSLSAPRTYGVTAQMKF